MTNMGWLQILLFVFSLLACVKPLGWYMASVYEGHPRGPGKLLRPLERWIYRFCRIREDHEMTWKGYLSSMLIFNLAGLMAVYLILRVQYYLPLNPQHFNGMAPDLAFNTAVSFSSNTNWQAYAGEAALSYFSQMFALTVQNFLSAATGMSLLIAMIRGIARHESKSLGNYWVDMVRGILYILMPLSLILAVILTSQGVIQNFRPYYQSIISMQSFVSQQSAPGKAGMPEMNERDNDAAEAGHVTEQVIPMGPAASQIAIKQLGTNGGGFFNTNSSHPFENPTPLTNFFEMLSILLIPAALCYTFGVMVNDRRQGWAVLSAMFILFVPLACLTIIVEQSGNPALVSLGVDQAPVAGYSSGGNMEGKEVRFGIVNSGLWAAATTAASNGSVNSMHDSYLPLGGLVPLWLMHLGEVVFGGVGSGLYGMLLLVIITVFISGQMIGRSPEYLGKKIEPFEMKMAALGVLIMPVAVLFFSAIAATTRMGIDAVGNPGAHGLTEMLYAFTSMANNNGSAFAGLRANTPFYNMAGGIAMLAGRYWIAIPALAIAGSLARKKIVPGGLGTLPTHSPLFVFLLIGVVILLGALTFFPVLALGPVAEHLMLWSQYGR
ncbi:Potassium-transporting ATPase A chain [Aquicella siphonis]|uniref:Potassium-transporting ATPase potassium-binding subunit n=1 Tax=Aquicella siphonis TaxID=254247 RepID=A0A5E4PL04_9COXI|nr:potassium-transporting ATPase subunit KdpA [Aquicella siphonis]VVC77215.1 Potassium-transporting ATPase A chain [Aquicella siphonis]